MFSSTDVARGLRPGEFSHLSARDRQKLVRLMARIAEKSYRRGVHQGVTMAQHREVTRLRDELWKWRSALEQPPGVVRVTYEGDQGQSFVARYERYDQVILELGDSERVLPEVSATSGTRYDDGTYELRLRGRNATLQGTAATYSNCVARDWQEAEPRRWLGAAPPV